MTFGQCHEVTITEHLVQSIQMMKKTKSKQTPNKLHPHSMNPSLNDSNPLILITVLINEPLDAKYIELK